MLIFDRKLLIDNYSNMPETISTNRNIRNEGALQEVEQVIEDGDLTAEQQLAAYRRKSQALQSEDGFVVVGPEENSRRREEGSR